MKKILIIACYFGKLPNYFKFWEKSCAYNSTIDFLLVTDQNVDKKYKNIKIKKCTLNDIELLIENKINIRPHNLTPYKLCDFKPAYGKIFEEYVMQYDFWGYCDIDLVFGNIRKFINDEILHNNEIILKLGHLTLYQKEHMELFKKDGAIYNYKVVYSNNEHYAFDEMSGMHKIFKKNNINPFCDIPIADIDKKYSRFKLYDRKNYRKQIFVFDNGIFRFFENNNISKDEYCYLHFQKKKIKLNTQNLDKFIIASDGFSNYSSEQIEKIDIEKHNIFKGVFYEEYELISYFFYKIKLFIMASKKVKKIWLKQKFARFY